MKRSSPNSLFQRFFPELSAFDKFNAAEDWFRISGGSIEARYVSPFTIILHKEGLYPIIGVGTWIGHFCIIDGSQGLEIGRKCEISCGVHIYTHSTHRRCTQGRDKQVAPVKIGNQVFIGPNSIISMGVTIESHAMVAPLSYVHAYTHIPQWAMFAGQPALKKGSMRTRK